MIDIAEIIKRTRELSATAEFVEGNDMLTLCDEVERLSAERLDFIRLAVDARIENAALWEVVFAARRYRDKVDYTGGDSTEFFATEQKALDAAFDVILRRNDP